MSNYLQGAKKTLSSNDNWSDAKSAWISAIIAAGVTLMCIFFALPLLKRMADRQFDRYNIITQILVSPHSIYIDTADSLQFR